MSGSECRCCVGFDWKYEVKAGSTVILDSLFNSLLLLDEMTEFGIGALGTLWQKRFRGTPVANKTTVAKKPTRFYNFATESKNLVVSCLDYIVNTCATNYVTCNPVSTA